MNEVEFHPFLAQDGMRIIAERNQLCLMAYSPLARGRVPKNDVLREIGARHGKSASQIALRWLTQHRNVCAIPKASSVEHLVSNLDIFDFELDAAEANRITSLERGQRLIDPEWAPEWGR